METHNKKLLEDQQVSATNGAERLSESTRRKSSEEYRNEDVVNFVVEDAKDPNSATENLKAAYESVTLHQLEAAWISFSDCLKVTTKKHCPFVMDPFDGPVFDHLVQLKCRVFGPICILSCLKNSESLPVRSHPVYSVAMRKITITCTNLGKSDREEVFRKAELMGAGCIKDLTKSVTHLVVGSVGSKKYRMAASLGLPIMTASWIAALWDHDQYNPERHASDIVYKVHQCPVFKGLSICISQLSWEERKTVKRLVEQNGGNYSGALRLNMTTHLILLQPEGEKYNHAVNWKLHCVKVDWVYDSVSAGYCKDEALYKLENEAVPRVSTPRKSSSHQLNLDAEISKISSVSVSCLDETTRLNSIGQRCDDESVASHKSSKESYCPLEVFDVALLSHCKRFLYGCKMLVIGFNDSHTRLLSKMIAQAGGTQFKKYSDGISHVILGEKNAELIENIKLGSSSPHVVSCQWLIECFNAQKMVDEAPYLYPGENALTLLKQDASLLAEEKENNFSGNVPQKTVSQNTEDLMNDASSIMKDCLAFGDDAQNNFVVPQHNDPSAVNQEQMNSKNFNENMASAVEKAANEHFSDAPTEFCEDEEEGYVSLKGIKFVIMGFGPKDTDILTDMIVSKEGDIYDLNAECEVDVAIVPVFWDEQPTIAKNIATNCWLQKCIEDEKLLPYDENPLFKPLCAQPCIQPLEKCVVSISQYIGTERDCLRHIAEVLGAVYQEHFVRKATKKTEFKPNTHLIVPAPEGSKYEAAKKWNIPAVTKEWLIDAAKFGERPPEEMYLVGGAAVKNQSSTATADCYHSARNDENHMDICDKLESECDAELKNVFKTPNSKVLCGNRLKELMKEDNNSSTKKNSSAFLNPDIPYHPDFNVGDMLDFLDSPCNPGNNGRSLRKQSIPIEEVFSHNLSLALEKFSSPKTDSGHNRQEDSKNPGNSKKKSPCKSGPLAGVIICMSKCKKLMPFKEELYKMVVALGGNHCSEYDRRCTHFVCQSPKNSFNRELRTARDEKKMLVAPEWILACKDSQKRVEEALYPPTYKSNVPLSSLITPKHSHSKGNARASKESNSERNNSKMHLEEENLDLSRQLDELIGVVKSVKTDQPRSGNIGRRSWSSPDPKKSMSDLKCEKKCKNSPKASSDANGKESTVTSGKREPRPLPFALDTASSEPSQFLPITWDDVTCRYEREIICDHMVGAGDQDTSSCSTCFPLNAKQHSGGMPKTILHPGGHANNIKHVSQPQVTKLVRPIVSAANRQRSSEPPQVTTVVRPDDVPTDNRQRSSEPPPMIVVCPGASAQSDYYPAGPQETTTHPMVQTGYRVPQRRFMFSGFSESEKEQFSSIILKYGGQISTDKSFDKEATHLILGKPLKNEKLLSSVASGRWVLHRSYLEAVEKNRAFVEEGDYEWGNKSTKSFLKDVPNDSETTMKVAYCPYRWRMKIANDNMNGAFCKWTVVIFSEKHKVSTYSKILRAGGATVVITSASSPNLDGVTHAFIELSYVSTMDIDIKLLMSSGVMCLKPEYLAYYLIEDPSPLEEDYLIPEAIEYLNSPRTASIMSKRRQNFSEKSAKKSRIW